MSVHSWMKAFHEFMKRGVKVTNLLLELEVLFGASGTLTCPAGCAFVDTSAAADAAVGAAAGASVGAATCAAFGTPPGTAVGAAAGAASDAAAGEALGSFVGAVLARCVCTDAAGGATAADSPLTEALLAGAPLPLRTSGSLPLADPFAGSWSGRFAAVVDGAMGCVRVSLAARMLAGGRGAPDGTGG